MRILTLLLLTVSLLSAQYEGPIPEPTSGYGALGPNDIMHLDIPNPNFFIKDISIFYPSETSGPVPTICFLHGFGANDTTTYIETLRHIASWGYATVFVPYKTINSTIPQRYQTLYEGFLEAAQQLPMIIDTSRIGLYGHSFGGGAIPATAYKLFVHNNWGVNGKFVFCNAPWYVKEMPQDTLDNFPSDCNMLTVLHDEDYINDHRMAMDIFKNIPIDQDRKDFIISYSDTVSGYEYMSSHYLPSQGNTIGLDAFNALDYLLTFRLLHSLSDYTFTGNTSAKEIALGNGSTSQIFMHNDLKDLSSTDDPQPIYNQSIYQNPCDSPDNERSDYCPTRISNDIDIELSSNYIQVYPNPAVNELTIMGNLTLYSIEILNDMGVLFRTITTNGNSHTIDIASIPPGLYFIKIKNSQNGNIEMQKILKMN